MPFTIEITDLANEELQQVKVHYRRQIVDAIDEQLSNQPIAETRNRKVLAGLHADFEHDEPIWELRVAQFRVYYDVSEQLMTVTVRAIREKPPHKTTDQVV
jgi:mRNA-degrading endonuclease RelE of RelBE toxin-antitoxin system